MFGVSIRGLPAVRTVEPPLSARVGQWPKSGLIVHWRCVVRVRPLRQCSDEADYRKDRIQDDAEDAGARPAPSYDSEKRDTEPAGWHHPERKYAMRFIGCVSHAPAKHHHTTSGGEQHERLENV
jgi:hypothetical protein